MTLKAWAVVGLMGWVITGLPNNYKACDDKDRPRVCLTWSGSLEELKSLVAKNDFPLCIEQSELYDKDGKMWVPCKEKK